MVTQIEPLTFQYSHTIGRQETRGGNGFFHPVAIARDEGDLQWNNDFRGTYATLLEQWMGLDSKAILRDSFEQLDFIKK